MNCLRRKEVINGSDEKYKVRARDNEFFKLRKEVK